MSFESEAEFTTRVLDGDSKTDKESVLSLISLLSPQDQDALWADMLERIYSRHEEDLYWIAVDAANDRS